MDLCKQAFSSFRPLRKKRAVVGEPIAVVLAMGMAIGEGSSSERTMKKDNIHCHEVLLSRFDLSNSLPIGGSDVVVPSTPLSKMRVKEVATPSLFAEDVAPTQEARFRFGHSEVIDFKQAKVSVGPKPAATAAGLKRAMGSVNSESVVAAGLVMAIVESVQLKLVDFKLNSPRF
ncbi:hypothetical protein F0562_007403 [Nyssa sinensis]|uniref:Uncharacterized protein n=1 Tax=Nyssa sinensis TaxID=561372 RepID=A0A5J5A5S3_9ASTE|nr:hypothetical protein F0562_007403 [Nyssa sinensis]